jgi:hypothetical protein
VTSPAAARGSGSPELGVPAAPGVKLTRAWVGRDLRDTCDLPRAIARHGEGLATSTTVGAVRRGGAMTARAFRPQVWSTAYDNWRKRSREWREAHQGVVEAGAAADGGSRRRPAAEGIGLSRGNVMPGVSGLLITGDRRVKVL